MTENDQKQLGKTLWNIADKLRGAMLHQIVQCGQLFGVEVVLGNAHIGLAHFGPAPVGQAHVGQILVGAGVDDLRRGVPGDGPVQLVLHGLEELDALRLCGVVIDAGGVDVGDLLIEASLAGADVLNPPQQLVEIIEGLVGVLQALIVEHKALDDVLAQTLRGPDAKTGSDRALHAVADGENDV